jgi:hypothetical protein
MLSDNDRFQLKKMLEANGVEDQTAKIRDNQHSSEIRRCIECIVEHKKKGLNKADLEAAIAVECSFLFFHYFEIYNMVLKDVDLTILNKLLDVLEQIEKGVCDQHEGSFLVGKLLKEVYIDGIIRETKDREVVRPKSKDISWTKFKSLPSSDGSLDDA